MFLFQCTASSKAVSTWCTSALHSYTPQTKLALLTGLYLGNGRHTGVDNEVGSGVGSGALIREYRHPSLEKLIGGCEIQEQWFVVALTLTLTL